MGSLPTFTGTVTSPGAFEELADSVLGGAAASISFTGISTDYRIFRLSAFIVKDANAGGMMIRLNNDSAANYDNQEGTGSATSVASADNIAASEWAVSGSIVANGHAAISAYIAKGLAAEDGQLVADVSQQIAAGAGFGYFDGIWNNTADLIDRIDLLATSNNFAADTAAMLEGNKTT